MAESVVVITGKIILNFCNVSYYCTTVRHNQINLFYIVPYDYDFR